MSEVRKPRGLDVPDTVVNSAWKGSLALGATEHDLFTYKKHNANWMTGAVIAVNKWFDKQSNPAELREKWHNKLNSLYPVVYFRADYVDVYNHGRIRPLAMKKYMRNLWVDGHTYGPNGGSISIPGDNKWIEKIIYKNPNDTDVPQVPALKFDGATKPDFSKHVYDPRYAAPMMLTEYGRIFGELWAAWDKFKVCNGNSWAITKKMKGCPSGKDGAFEFNTNGIRAVLYKHRFAIGIVLFIIVIVFTITMVVLSARQESRYDKVYKMCNTPHDRSIYPFWPGETNPRWDKILKWQAAGADVSKCGEILPPMPFNNPHA